jgi:hypothetical protein
VSKASCAIPGVSFQSLADGVAHEEQSLSFVRSANARRCKIRRPDGVSLRFQVSRNMVEPSEPIRTRNLLSKDDWRTALADEPKPRRPEMTGILETTAFSGAAERLAWTRARPNRSNPLGEFEGVGPAADPGEEVALLVSGKVGRLDQLDVSLVNVAFRDESFSDEFSEPSGSESVVLVVVDIQRALRALIRKSAIPNSTANASQAQPRKKSVSLIGPQLP